MSQTCTFCHHHCNLQEGKTGFCRVRTLQDGKNVCGNYGFLTSLALDPIEKKPLNRFYPGTTILSLGSYGCNLRCPFCQNYDISWSEEAKRFADTAETFTPEELVELALRTKSRGNIGIAFTYNEPLVGWEFVRDTAKLAKDYGLKTVLVTNGTAELSVLREIAPYVDAMNVDLKGFTDRYYREVLGGDRGMVMAFIEEAVKTAHVELTTLIVPGENDSEEEMRELSAWVSGLRLPDGESVPLHVTRFFPRFHMTDRKATDVRKIYRLAEIAREKLDRVHTGHC